MRLHSITVRNYRRHKELRVELDAARTLIGGPNESGKSTLVEAAHRALFLKAKGNTETHRRMESLVHPGKPEVELEFEAGGHRYELIKCFKGGSGSTRLTQAGGASWQGDEAEEKLATLLKTQGSGRKPLEQWSHLWVWQGSSASDPLPQAEAERDTLVQRLQAQGGAAVIQSVLDTRVADFFAAQNKALFQDKGEPRKNSDLGLALQAEEDAKRAEAEAQGTVQKLDQAISQHELATRQMAEAEAALRTMETERAALAHRFAEVGKLRLQEQDFIKLAEAARKAHEGRVTADDNIVQLRRSLEKLRLEMAPQKERQEVLTQALASARQRTEEAEGDGHKAEEKVREERARFDWLQARLSLAEKNRQLASLTEKEKQVLGLLEKRAVIEKKAEGLPKIDAAAVASLQALERAHDKALAMLQGVATEIRLVVADAPVRLGQELLKSGEWQTLTSETELTVGTAKLTLRPGGGTTLADARTQEKEAALKLEAFFTRHGVKSAAEARAASAERDQLQGEWKMLTAELKSLAHEKLNDDLAEARRAVMTAEAEAERRKLDEVAEATESPALRRQALENAESALQACRVQREQATTTWKKAESALTSHSESLRENARRLDELNVRLAVLTENEGDDAERAMALQKTRDELTLAEARLAATREDLQRQQPENLEAEQARFDRARMVQTEKKAEAQRRHIEAATLLRSDGSHDPAAALALATARAQAAKDHREVAQRHALALRRVHQLMLEEQHTLADLFTRPLATRVDGYLQCLFGHEVRVDVTLQNNAFEGLSLSRGGAGAFAFDSLSNGAREQVAAAFRLALAEILAESHEGSLPVVFDDAFAHSDPERVQHLQRMLDLAASRGLQIIVLTCTPGEYAMMGAKEIRIG